METVVKEGVEIKQMKQGFEQKGDMYAFPFVSWKTLVYLNLIS